jgi:hypothetical protein
VDLDWDPYLCHILRVADDQEVVHFLPGVLISGEAKEVGDEGFEVRLQIIDRLQCTWPRSRPRVP